MSYAVKEIYYTLQGEGAHAGRAAVFCRFSGCNLWTGREADRGRAICQFCDTEFVGTDGEGGGRFATPEELADAVMAAWPTTATGGSRYVVCTGGEPLLQLDTPLIGAFHRRDFEVGIETNGTIVVPEGVDWVCVSPKANTELVVRQGDEIKLVYPQPNLLPDRVSDLRFGHRFLQPMDGPSRGLHTRQTIEYCLAHPQWRLSLQTHKLTGLK
jgi:7-carboxy-7-deazaguanine synthase (Cx14CxxC type)